MAGAAAGAAAQAVGDAADRLLARGWRADAVAALRARAGGRFEAPADIARVLDAFGYEHDWALAYRVRPAEASLLRPRIMCLNAALLAYALLLECFPAVPRSLLLLYRRGPDGTECGHAVAAWWQGERRAGAFSRSNHAALGHRAPCHAGLEALALSYARGYATMGFTPLYYGSVRPETLPGLPDWRRGEAPLDTLAGQLAGAYEYAFDIRAPHDDHAGA
jgi:hypothetical protein